MSPRVLLRALTPLGWVVLAAVLVAVLFIAGRGLGFHWDPFGFQARRLEAAESRAEAMADDALARSLEVEGAVVQADRLEQHHQQAVGLARATTAAEAQARDAHDAQLPLDPDRAARLRAHDGELCRLAADVCTAAPVDSAGSRPDPLSPRPAAADADTV